MRYASEAKFTELHKQNILFFLIQEELFDWRPQPATRRQLKEWLGIGERKVLSAITPLMEHGLLAQSGIRPVRYSLSEKGKDLFLN